MSGRSVLAAMVLLASCAACEKQGPATYQGYVEGEFLYVGAGTGGRLEKLFVERGQSIQADAPLFQLEATQETAALQQADETAAAARAQLADLQTGKRTPE